jgi:hypothetical protein
MLIQLDNSLLDSLWELTEPEWDGLHNLAIAAREGNHYLIAPRELAQSLSHAARLGLRERTLYRVINERYSTLAGMAHQVSFKVRVARDIVADRIVAGRNVEITLPLSYFSSTTTIQPVILLCENLDDCKLIYEFVRTFAHAERLGAIKTSLDMRPGGGSTTADVAESILRPDRRMLVAVVDSDRESPGGALGGTALNTRRVFANWQRATSELIILKGRDLENLLPDEFYRTEFGQDSVHGGSVAFIAALVGSNCGSARLHIDIKKGLMLKDILKRPNPPQDFEGVWGAVVTSVAKGRLPCSEACVGCADAGSCSSPNACGCILSRSNSADLLSRGRVGFQHHGRQWWRTLPDCLKSPLSELARTVFDWGCAGSFQST